MWKGEVASLYTASAAKGPMRSLPLVRAVPGRGLEGDRYFGGTGTFCSPCTEAHEVTLIELEAVEALARDYGVRLSPGDVRRNVVTRGVLLNHLVGREFRVGEVRLSGIRLAEPCSHLQRLTQPGVIKGLRHRGGLRAQVLSPGVIRVGDVVEE